MQQREIFFPIALFIENITKKKKKKNSESNITHHIIEPQNLEQTTISTLV
jgi:hypothetical protein